MTDEPSAADVEELAALLERRPEVLGPTAPRDLDELGERLHDPDLAMRALEGASAAVLHLARGLCALGGRPAPARLAELLGATVTQLAEPLRWLLDRRLVQPTDGDLLASPGLQAVMDELLDLGPPLLATLEHRSTDALHQVLERLGEPPEPSRDEAVETLLLLLGDPERVRAVAAQAPPAAQRWLLELAFPSAHPDEDPSWNPPQDAAAWADERGLVVLAPWGLEVVMAREVTLALCGPGLRFPFDHAPPPLPRVPVDPVALQLAAGVAAREVTDRASAVLDRIAEHPAPLLRAGGLGTRELGRLARAVGVEGSVVRLVVELAAALGLLETRGGLLAATPVLTTWRDADATARFGDLLTTWWSWPGVPTDDVDADRTRPALLDGRCPACRRGRQTLVRTVSDGAGAVLLAGAAERAAWVRPLEHATARGGTEPFARTWAEAQVLGVLAPGGPGPARALTALGTALLRGDASALRAEVGRVLPTAGDRPTQNLVTGAPPLDVRALARDLLARG